MPPLTLTVARARLLEIDTGVNRRLLYLASGHDVGCSVGLFWHKCDSFYLVDPHHSITLTLETLERGADHMSGMRVQHSPGAEQGYWDGIVAGHRYQVWTDTHPSVTKRLCFASSGSGTWLASTNTHYNVAIAKDYAGFENSPDANFPYTQVWDKLNYRGIFAETIGSARSNARYDFAKYRHLGFTPLFNVLNDSGKQVGFNDGLWLFQKADDANAAHYEARQAELDDMQEEVNAIFDIFIGEADFGRGAIANSAPHAGLFALMNNAPLNRWSALAETNDFADWVKSALPPKYRNISRALAFELVAALRPATWETF